MDPDQFLEEDPVALGIGFSTDTQQHLGKLYSLVLNVPGLLAPKN